MKKIKKEQKQKLQECIQLCINSYLVSKNYNPNRNKEGEKKQDWKGFNRKSFRYFSNNNADGFFIKKQKDKNTLYLVLTGSNEDKDWSFNFSFFQKQYGNKLKNPYTNVNPKIKVHEGFTNYYKLIRNQIHSLLKDYLKKNKKLKLIITGHSLGAATATLAAVDINYNFNIEPELYIFGSPRVGNNAFVKSFNKRIKTAISCLNDSDPVSSEPPVIFGYKHIVDLFQVDKSFFAGWLFHIPLFNLFSVKDHYPYKYRDNIKKW